MYFINKIEKKIGKGREKEVQGIPNGFSDWHGIRMLNQLLPIYMLHYIINAAAPHYISNI